jgi:hypothetical protein
MGIVERLREHNEPPFDYIAHEAADMIEQLRKVLLTVLEACEDVNSPDQKVRKEITRTVGKALKESAQ